MGLRPPAGSPESAAPKTLPSAGCSGASRTTPLKFPPQWLKFASRGRTRLQSPVGGRSWQDGARVSGKRAVARDGSAGGGRRCPRRASRMPQVASTGSPSPLPTLGSARGLVPVLRRPGGRSLVRIVFMAALGVPWRWASRWRRIAQSMLYPESVRRGPKPGWGTKAMSRMGLLAPRRLPERVTHHRRPSAAGL
jgi:hypothetical protein